MERITYNPHLYKAFDAYPYEISETMEALQFAMSYDDLNVQVWCMLGRVHMEQFQDYEAAKSCFEQAMSIDIEWPGIYPLFITVLFRTQDFDAAEKLICFADSIQKVHKGVLAFYEGRLREYKGQYKEAMRSYKRAGKYYTDKNTLTELEDEIQKVKKRIGKQEGKKKKKAKAKK
ncbi:tetratricopeptide repeat protein [Robertkochia solimangrovi]|uniref:tetratricopeptide repeat protein n=1 Tax=Robertkochia solimangrovi TaxID=2213046 RepID=UPI00117FF917|nr:tetratricopeptide repeat protein [Robertkochia solimangrovi]TRZ43571.1 hypothetical protein DMZ48_09110 [Robertkochia solimangrovi]